MKEPIPDYDLPVIDPFKPGHTAAYGNSKTGLRQTYSNAEIFGFTNINSTNATYYSKNVKQTEFDSSLQIQSCVGNFGYKCYFQ